MKRIALALALATAFALPTHADNCGASKATPASHADAPTRDIIESALAAGSFNTLATALANADLIDALRGEGPFTVFAPSDEAFARLPSGTVEDLLKPENRDRLVSILTYHVVPGRLDSKAILGGAGAASLNGQRLHPSLRGGELLIDESRVVQADIQTTNGIIHVIDRVLLPH